MSSSLIQGHHRKKQTFYFKSSINMAWGEELLILTFKSLLTTIYAKGYLGYIVFQKIVNLVSHS